MGELRRLAIVILVVALAACGSGAPQPVEVPRDSRIWKVVSQTSTRRQLVAAVDELEMGYVCGAGGDGRTGWEACVLLDEGMTVLVPFASRPGMRAVMTGPGYEEGVEFDLEKRELRGLPAELSPFAVDFYLGNTRIGSLDGG